MPDHGTEKGASFLKLIDAKADYIEDAFNEFDKILSLLKNIPDTLGRQQPPLLFFGDSTLHCNDDQDEQGRTLLKLVAQHLGYDIAAFESWAFAPPSYLNIARILPEATARTKRVIICLNLRSFSDEWFLRPLYQFNSLNAVARYHLKESSFRDSFRAFFEILYTDKLRLSHERFLAMETQCGQIAAITELIASDSENQGKYCYAFPDNYIRSRIAPYIETALVLLAKGYEVIPYITPCCWSPLNEDDRARVGVNAALIVETFKGHGVDVIDFSTLFEDHSDFTCAEHLCLRARMILAGHLIEAIEPGRGKPSEEGEAHSYFAGVMIHDQTRQEPCQLYRADGGENFFVSLSEAALLTLFRKYPSFCRKYIFGKRAYRIRQAVETAELMRKNGRNTLEAAELIKKSAKKYFDSKQLYFYLGNLYRDGGDFEKAISSYRAAIEASCDDLPPGQTVGSVYYNLALCLRRTGELRKAEDILSGLWSENNENELYALELAKTFWLAKKRCEALAFIKDYTEAHPGAAEARSLFFMYLYMENQKEELLYRLLRSPKQKGLAATGGAETKIRDLDDWLSEVKKTAAFPANGKIGAIVMNCNPFTLGHLYLIEKALETVDYLYIFVVREDSSEFSFKDRIYLVKQGTRHLGDRVRVVPSGDFIISKYTFPEYFTKSGATASADSIADVFLFGAYIAPALKIGQRFVGDEPNCIVTDGYNRTMGECLPALGLGFHIIPRRESSGAAISASRVRRMLKDKNFDEIKKLVPESTYTYLSNPDNYRMMMAPEFMGGFYAFGEGWGPNEADGALWRWTLKQRASIYINHMGNGGGRLVLEFCNLYPGNREEPLEAAIQVNDREVCRLTLRDGTNQIILDELPETQLIEIAVITGKLWSPVDFAINNDGRKLGLALTKLEKAGQI
ncbi:hypothetical protein C4J81_18845 (plasmid) [Deltaproteobacteria bacterium Smac51]|nr:hypothetical protein C4J81_18845 [Deltaproteobacteria bacterium Smac51]